MESNKWLEKNGQDDPSGAKILPQSGVCVTSAGNLPCKYVIHAVGPSWNDSESASSIQRAALGSRIGGGLTPLHEHVADRALVTGDGQLLS